MTGAWAVAGCGGWGSWLGVTGALAGAGLLTQCDRCLGWSWVWWAGLLTQCDRCLSWGLVFGLG